MLGGLPFPNPNLKWTGYTSWNCVSLAIYGAIVLFSLQGIIVGVLTWFTYKASKMYSSLTGLTLINFTCALISLTLGAFFVTIGHISFAYYKISIATDKPLGLLYTFSLALAIALSGIAAFFFTRLAVIYGESRRPATSDLWLAYLLLGLLWVSMLCPYNWYAMYPDRPYWLNVRPLTNGLLALMYVIAAVRMIISIVRKLKIETDAIRKHRMKVMGVSFVLLAIFYVWYALEELLQVHLVVMYIVLFILATFATISMYLSLVTPSWYMEWLERRFSKK